MNPVVLAAVAVSFVAVGAVSMSSLASQQAINGASMQRMTLERDRLTEQVSAYISAVTPSDSGTLATVKNTGTSPVVIDHCILLSPSNGTSRQAGTKLSTVSNKAINPGSTLEITIPGAVSGDNIKCVTSKGTVLQVRIEAGGKSQGQQSPDPNNYFDLYSMSADVGVRTAASYSTGDVVPVNRPSDPPVTIPPGNLVYHIPVESTVTVNSVTAYYDDGASGTIIGGPVTFEAGQKIDVPVSKAIDRVEIRYVDPVTSQQSSFIARPSQVSAMTTTLLSGPTVVGIDVGQGADTGSLRRADGSVITNRGYVWSESKYASQLGYGGPGGRMRCSGNWIGIIPVYQGVTNSYYMSKTDLTCVNGWNTVFQDPVSTINVNFKAPKPSFLVQIDYTVDVRGGTSDSDSYPLPFTATLRVNNGQRQIQLQGDITEVTEDSDGLYSADHRIFESGSITLQITNAIPGQDMIIPVDLYVHGSTSVKLACGCSSGFSGSMFIRAPSALGINLSLSQ